MIDGRFADAATAKASATRNAMLSFCAGMASSDRDAADHEGRDPGDLDLAAFSVAVPFLNTLA